MVVGRLKRIRNWLVVRLYRWPVGRRFRWMTKHERRALGDLFEKYGFIFWRRQITEWTPDLASLSRSVGSRLKRELPNSPPDISFVIPVHNQLRFTLACLESIAAQETDCSFEILVGDDASFDDTASALKLVACVRRVSHVRQLGFVENCNLTARHAQGRYIAFLNNDVVLFPDWLGLMLNTFATAPDTGLLGGMLLYPDGRLQEAGCTLESNGETRAIGFGEVASAARFHHLMEVDYCSGAGIVIPAPLWFALDGFAADFSPAYYEDVDLAFRVRQHGFKVRCQPAAKAIHFRRQTYKGEPDAMIDQNRQRFLGRWEQQIRSR